MFFLGMVIGSTIGVVIMCIMQVAGASDNPQ